MRILIHLFSQTDYFQRRRVEIPVKELFEQTLSRPSLVRVFIYEILDLKSQHQNMKLTNGKCFPRFTCTGVCSRTTVT